MSRKGYYGKAVRREAKTTEAPFIAVLDLDSARCLQDSPYYCTTRWVRRGAVNGIFTALEVQVRNNVPNTVIGRHCWKHGN